MNKKFENCKPDDIVKSCVYLEKGVYFMIWGATACNNSTIHAPILINTDEMNNGTLSYDLIRQRRIDLFEIINGFKDGDSKDCKKCSHLVEKKFRDVNFDNLGGEPLAAGMGIQHYTTCNEKCTYCCYAQENNFKKPQYDVLQFFETFREKGKLKGNNWIDFSGGEPTLLKDFDNIIQYLTNNNLGTIVVYSNGLKYSQKIYELLKEDKIILTTSVDTGIKSSYAQLRGVDGFSNVFTNLLRYRSSGTHNLWLKYVVCESNRTEDDLWSFITTMVALRPNRIMLCPDFPYGDRQIPIETVKFIAKLWCECERILGITPVDFTATVGDPKLVVYHKDLAEAIDKYKNEHPYTKKCMAPPLAFNSTQCCEKINYKQRVKKLLPKIKNIIKLSV